MEVTISKIRAVLKTKNGSKIIAKIEDTPHYKLLCGNKDAYVNYLFYAKHPVCRLRDFETLISNFQYSRMGDIKLEKVGEHYLIRDGLHRIAILYFKGFKTINFNNR